MASRALLQRRSLASVLGALTLSSWTACNPPTQEGQGERAPDDEPDQEPPPHDPECDGSCQYLGACVLVDGSCTATVDAHCRQSAFCSESGWCTAKDGSCAATSHTDCAASSSCQSTGKC